MYDDAYPIGSGKRSDYRERLVSIEAIMLRAEGDA